MNILFICKSNISRSQCAEEFFNQKSKKHRAISAGISPIKEGQEIIQNIPETKNAREDAERYGLHIGNKIRKQITENLLSEVDQVYVLLDQKEVPEDIKNNPKVIMHPFKNKRNLPKEDRDQVISDIKKFAEDLAKSLDESH